jgi:predicted GTPase
MNACTNDTTYEKVFWKDLKKEFMVIDTPGFEESAEADDTHCTEMIFRLQRIKYVNGIFIVLNGAEPRLSAPLKNMLITF